MRGPRVGAGSARTARGAVLRGLAGFLSVAAMVGVAGCSAPSKPEVVPSAGDVTPAVTVRVIDNQYVLAEVEIEVGEAVRWVFEGAMEHDVVAADASFVSELTTTGEYTHVFEAAGEFSYDCSVHPEMTGLVRVTE